MRKVDAFLSRIAQGQWPTAVVWFDSSEGNGLDRYILERHGVEDILLGHQFKEVRVSLDVLVNSEQAVRLLDPANILRRGYSITHLNGKTVKDASLVKKGDVIKTRVHTGAMTSIVEYVKEAGESEQGQTDYLFSGTDRA